ncbi:hypothetical protein [Thiobacillus sp.]
MKSINLQRGVTGAEFALGIGAVIVVALIVGVIVSVANEFESGGTGDPADPFTQGACSTKCTWLREKNCENNRDIGWCFPTWGCGDEVGLHRCEN